MADRATLASATVGTGPYVLSEAAPGDHYTYTIRDGYTWGPNGATTATAGMPGTVVLRIVENPATAANLLLTGDVNAAAVIGPDAAAARAGEPVHRRHGRAVRRDVVQPCRGPIDRRPRRAHGADPGAST